MNIRLVTRILLLLAVIMALVGNRERCCACTVFLASDSVNVFAGNNEDYKDTSTIVKFIPASDGKFGRVMFGFEKAFPQGGVNEKGLFFDGLAVGYLEVKDTVGKPDYDDFLAEKALEECSTVEEVISLFNEYNLSWLAHAQLMFGDRNGNSAIFEGDSILVKQGRYQVATNFYQSQMPKDSVTCERYQTAVQILESEKTVSKNLCREILDKTHMAGKSQTVYSTIYDLKLNLVYVYCLHDFTNEVVLDLSKDLITAERTVRISSLFDSGE